MRSYLHIALAVFAFLLLGAPPAHGAQPYSGIANASIPATGPFVQTQTGRLAPGLPSACTPTKAVPAVVDPGMSFNFVGFGEQSLINEPACVTVALSSADSTCRSNGLFSASYIGNFSPSNIQTNYTGDVGASPSSSAPVTYSYLVSPGQSYITIVHMSMSGVGCGQFDIDWTANRPWTASRPQISGHPFVGETLTSVSSGWSGNPSFTRQWRRCALDGSACADIPGATDTTYTPGPVDVGHSLVFRVTATESAMSSTADSFPAPVGIQFDALNGQSLDGSEPTQNGRLALPLASPARCGTSKTATGTTDAVHTRFYDVYGRVNQSDSALCTIVSLDTTTSCTPGTNGAVSAAYLPSFQPATSLQKNYLADGGSKAQSSGRTMNYGFDVPAGAAYEVVVSTVDTGVTCPAYDLRLGTAAPYPTSPPTIGGTATEGQTLTAADGTWTGAPTFTHQWLRCFADGSGCADLPGATDSTLALHSADVGHAYRMRVTGNEGAGSASKLSGPSGAVVAAPPVPPPPYAGIHLTPLTKIVGKKGLVTLSITCPAEAVLGCTGTDAIKLKKVTLASKPFALAPGKTAKLVFTLPKGVRKQLAKRKKLNATQVVSSFDLRNLPVRTSAKLTLKRR